MKRYAAWMIVVFIHCLLTIYLVFSAACVLMKQLMVYKLNNYFCLIISILFAILLSVYINNYHKIKDYINKLGR